MSAPAERPPDRPGVPSPPRGKGIYIFGGIAVIVVGLYGALSFTGWEPGAPKRDEIPGSVRASPGGYRSYQYWHSGYHGGK